MTAKGAVVGSSCGSPRAADGAPGGSDEAGRQGQAAGLIVAIDVGGSKIAAALSTRSGEALRVQRVRTERDDLDELLKQLSNLVEGMVAQAPRAVDAVALAVPGVLDPETGTAVGAANLPWRNTPLAEVLTRRIGIPTIVGGDGEGATLAEGWFGAARGVRNYACLVVGTGIGGGIVVDGAFVRGAGLRCPEIGHMVVAPWGPRCRCGGRGCLEALAAGPAILARAQALGSSAEDGKAVHLAAKAGEPAAQRAFAEAGGHIAVVVASLWRLFEPSRFFLGGGVASADEVLLGPVRSRLAELAPPRAALAMTVLQSELPADASYLAAVALQLQEDARRAGVVPA